jgi:hypothetical protein
MLLEDFLKAVRLVMMRRLKMDEWDVARSMSVHSAALERCYHEGYSPVEAISEITETDLPEYFGDPDFDPTTLKDVPEMVRDEALLLPSLKVS